MHASSSSSAVPDRAINCVQDLQSAEKAFEFTRSVSVVSITVARSKITFLDQKKILKYFLLTF